MQAWVGATTIASIGIGIGIIYGIPQYLVLKQKQITRRQKKYNVFPKRFYNTEGLDDIEMQVFFSPRLPAGMRSL